MHKGFAWLLGGMLALAPARALAWLEHEHEHVVHEGLVRLEPERLRALSEAWALARAARPTGLCESLTDVIPAEGEPCAGLSALALLAGDHSCSPGDLSQNLRQGWVLDVLRVAKRMEAQLLAADAGHDRLAHLDAWRQGHLDYQSVDHAYLTRAEGNNAHFQLPRKGETLEIHLAWALYEKSESNAVALWVNYHAAALELADEARAPCDDEACERRRADLLWRALSTEAFALHFLSDTFSSGHIVGNRGSSATRMGTHDFYSEEGVDAQTWSHNAYAVHGDSFLDVVDSEFVARAVGLSLAQLADVLRDGKASLGTYDRHVLSLAHPTAELDSCKARSVPPGVIELQGAPFVIEVLSETLRPAKEKARWPEDDPDAFLSFPRMPNEVGVFYTPSLSVAARFDLSDPSLGDRIPLRLAAAIPGIGFALDGITARNMDGIAYLRLPLLLDGSVPGAATPPRVGVGIEWHIPFVLIPGDLLPLALVALFDAETFLELASTAAAGGIPGRWQRSWQVGDSSSLQVVLGRHGTVAVYADDPGRQTADDNAADFVGLSDDGHGYVQIQLPVLALTGRHIYAKDLALDSVFRLGYDLSIRDGSTFHGVFLSWGFDIRRYFYRF